MTKWRLRKNVQKEGFSTCLIGMANLGRSSSPAILNHPVGINISCIFGYDVFHILSVGAS